MIEHDGCESCKYFNPKEVTFTSDSYCYECSQSHTKRVLDDKYEPMTNADRIRAMSDEELAEFLVRVKLGLESEKHIRVYNMDIKQRFEWLQSEAESVEE